MSAPPDAKRIALAISAVVLAAGCGDARLYPLMKMPPPPVIITDCPTDQKGFSTVGGGTRGGGTLSPVEVSTEADLRAWAALDGAAVIHLIGTLDLTGLEAVDVTSNKTIIGVGEDAGLTGAGLDLSDAQNVVVRNLTISKAIGVDAIQLQRSTNIWIDHCDLSSDRDHDIDYYDGLVDVTHASDNITVSWTRFHDHMKPALVGHSKDNMAEDDMHLTVTYHHNKFVNTNAGIRVRFGKVHVFNNYFLDVIEYGVVSQMDADVYVEQNVFRERRTRIGLSDGDDTFRRSRRGRARTIGNGYSGSGVERDHNGLDLESGDGLFLRHGYAGNRDGCRQRLLRRRHPRSEPAEPALARRSLLCVRAIIVAHDCHGGCREMAPARARASRGAIFPLIASSIRGGTVIAEDRRHDLLRESAAGVVGGCDVGRGARSGAGAAGRSRRSGGGAGPDVASAAGDGPRRGRGAGYADPGQPGAGVGWTGCRERVLSRPARAGDAGVVRFRAAALAGGRVRAATAPDR